MEIALSSFGRLPSVTMLACYLSSLVWNLRRGWDRMASPRTRQTDSVPECGAPGSAPGGDTSSESHNQPPGCSVSQIQKLSYHPDAIDWQIVDALKDFGRRTNTELASELGINETTVRKRIARLLREGLMNVVAVPNPLKMGYTVVALIGVTAAANQIEQVERAVLKIPSVRYAAMTTGSFDFMLEAWFVSSDDLRLFLVEELGKIPGVVRSETFHVLKLIKHLSDWGLPDQVSSQ